MLLFIFIGLSQHSAKRVLEGVVQATRALTRVLQHSINTLPSPAAQHRGAVLMQCARKITALNHQSAVSSAEDTLAVYFSHLPSINYIKGGYCSGGQE